VDYFSNTDGVYIRSGFVANGCTVYISSRKADACDAAAKQLTKLGPGICHSIPADISTKEGCDFVATELAKREKHLNVLINNAGANWGETFENYPDQAFDKVLALNVKSIFNLTRACFTLLKSAATETVRDKLKISLKVQNPNSPRTGPCSRY
jgi:NAD(P)-dependent dehydrogenase (short-subunit alcohol dehydrogenase family)